MKIKDVVQSFIGAVVAIIVTLFIISVIALGIGVSAYGWIKFLQLIF
ncbi:hypothetical protein phiCTP1_gp41 [Clostridium phage phiCTP1]|nr:hypothetical protein phiCTP1_gp41 [Clostridium phage phiCTP1]ADL40342.1 hypothetical phage protein [Clostridium phage phiCTP1]WMU07973.1 hypothetical protein vBCtySFA88_00041 [Clostridium phage vB_CtyS-FA88]